MNPLVLAHEIHDLARCINLLSHEEAFGAREIKRMTIQIDNCIHEIIADYERRGMEYDGPSSQGQDNPDAVEADASAAFGVVPIP